MKLLGRSLLALLILALLVPTGFRLAAMARETRAVAEARPDSGRMIETAMGQIYVQEFGPPSGTPVLLAHGTGAWSGLWATTGQALSETGYRAIAFDMPPFGFSERDTTGRYDRKTQAQRILALTDAMAIRPVLVAHSFGAAPAVEAVMRGPTKFAGLVLVDGAIGLGSHDKQKSLPLPLRPRWLRQVVVSMTATNPLLTKTLLSSLLYNKDAATRDNVKIIQRPMQLEGSTSAFSDWLPSLLVPSADALSTRPENYRDLSLPVRLIWGAQDTVTPPEQAEALADLIGQERPHLLTDTGHIPQIESPKSFQALLFSVLSDMREGN